MKINNIRCMVLGLSAILPACLHAQDPAMSPGGSMPQQQTMPSAAASSGQGTQQDSIASPGMTGQEMQDKQFLREMAQGGLAEVKIGQLAATKAHSDDVKAFGTKMVADHTQMGKELSPLADAMGIRLPKDLSKTDQAEYDKLSKLSGEEFDKEYITAMLADHRKDLRAFRQEAMSTNDSALRAEIDKSASVVREHMGLVVKLARENGVAVPPRPQGPGGPPPQR